MKRKGIVVAVTGMSGSGKDSIAKAFYRLANGEQPIFWKDMPSSYRNEFSKLKGKVVVYNKTFRHVMGEYGYTDVKEFAADVEKARLTGTPEELVGFDKRFDEMVNKEVQELRKNYKIVFVTNRLGPWMIKDVDLKVALKKTPEQRAEHAWLHRNEDRPDLMKFKSKDELIKYFIERDKNDIKRYKEIYGIDITDLKNFFIIDSYHNTPEHSAWLIFQELKKRKLLGQKDP